MLYFVVPVYNEELNIDELARSLKNALPDEKKFFVFVDDCSKDSTIEKIRSCFSLDEVNIITKSVNKGPGDSFNLGFEYLLSKEISNDDLVITIEADNTSDVNILEKMVSLSRMGFDLVLASPYAQGGGFEETTIWRRFLSFVANSLLRFCFDIKVLTLSSFYRIYKPSLLKCVKDKYGVIIKEPGFICMVANPK